MKPSSSASRKRPSRSFTPSPSWSRKRSFTPSSSSSKKGEVVGIRLAVEVVYAIAVLIAEAVVYAVAVGIDIADNGRRGRAFLWRPGLGANGTGQQGAGDDSDDDHVFSQSARNQTAPGSCRAPSVAFDALPAEGFLNAAPTRFLDGCNFACSRCLARLFLFAALPMAAAIGPDFFESCELVGGQNSLKVGPVLFAEGLSSARLGPL